MPHYSGFKREEWELQTLSEQRKFAQKHQTANTIAEQKPSKGRVGVGILYCLSFHTLTPYGCAL